MTRRRSLWVSLLIFGLAALLLFLALRGMDWQAFFDTLRQGRYAMLPLLFLWGSLTYFIRALRWRVLLSAERLLPSRTVFWANMAGYLGNSFLPARAGELVRSLLLGQKEGISSSFILATALTERLLDVIALLIISALALLSLPGLAAEFVTALQILAVVGGVGLLVVLFAPHMQDLFRRITAIIPIPEKWRASIDHLSGRFLDGMRSLQNPGRATSFVLLTALVWLADGLGTMLGGFMLRLEFSLPQALLLLAGLGLSSAIPSTPGYVGVYQFAAVTVLTPFGFTKSEALAYILVAQAFNYLLVTIWGLPGLWLLRK
jgi:hypothetical protein